MKNTMTAPVLLCLGIVLMLSACTPQDGAQTTSLPTTQVRDATGTAGDAKPTTGIPVARTLEPTGGADVTTPGAQPVTISPDLLNDYEAIARQIQANFPEVASITPYLTPQPFKGDVVFMLERGDRIDVVFQHGEHDCAAGCLDHYYWYFTVWPDGKIETVGAFQRVRGSNNQYVEKGTPMWGYPR